MKGKTGNNLLSGLASAITFLVLFIVLNWGPIISLVLSIGVFFGIFFLTKPSLKLGEIEVEKLQDGRELLEIFNQSKAKIEEIGQRAGAINNVEISSQGKTLYKTGQDIIRHLEEKPEDISSSRHFLTYYLDTSLKILSNYQDLKRANVSEGKFIEITEKTDQSLDLLIEVFKEQRDGYQKEKFIELEIQSELLEKTIKLRGDDI